jgi:hypothetical protein
VNASQPSLLLERVFYGFIYLRVPLKINFNEEHSNNTTVTLRELADLHNIYLNTFSKYRKIQYRIHDYYMPRGLYI